MTDIDYGARVQRGIALMDEKWPNWAAEIDLGKLDIKSSNACMTAQYAASQGEPPWFGTGQELLDLDNHAYEAHGFNVDGDSTGEAAIDDDGYPILNGLWKAEIERRRAAAQAAPAETGEAL